MKGRTKTAHTTPSTQVTTSSCRAGSQCLLKNDIFSPGLRTRRILTTFFTKFKRRTHCHYIGGWIGRLLIVLINFLAGYIEGRGERCIFCALRSSKPGLVKSFQCRYGEMKCRHLFRGEGLLCVVCVLRSALGYEREYESRGIHLTTRGKYRRVPILHPRA